MADRCPLCGQALPEKISLQELHLQLEGMAEKKLKAALSSERKKIEEQFEIRLMAEKEHARQQAERMASREVGQLQEQVRLTKNKAADDARKLANDFERKLSIEREQAKKNAEKVVKQEVEARLKRTVAEAVRSVAQENEERVNKIEGNLAKERIRHEADRAKLLTQVESLSRKLENRTGQELGEEGELDLFQVLRRTFAGDHIQRIGKGVKGGDILHEVIEGSKVAGRIVYESKNVATWQNGFVAQAKKYQTQYETPYAVIVSRVFPKKEKDLCICGDIPVVSPRMTLSLATILREAVVEISKLRQAGASPDETALKLFEYVISDRFATRFREMAENVDALKDEHRKERDWHERNWERRSSLHERIETRHREIHAQVDTILREGIRKKPISIAARASR